MATKPPTSHFFGIVLDAQFPGDGLPISDHPAHTNLPLHEVNAQTQTKHRVNRYDAFP